MTIMMTTAVKTASIRRHWMEKQQPGRKMSSLFSPSDKERQLRS